MEKQNLFRITHSLYLRPPHPPQRHLIPFPYLAIALTNDSRCALLPPLKKVTYYSGCLATTGPSTPPFCFGILLLIGLLCNRWPSYAHADLPSPWNYLRPTQMLTIFYRSRSSHNDGLPHPAVSVRPSLPRWCSPTSLPDYTTFGYSAHTSRPPLYLQLARLGTDYAKGLWVQLAWNYRG